MASKSFQIALMMFVICMCTNFFTGLDLFGSAFEGTYYDNESGPLGNVSYVYDPTNGTYTAVYDTNTYANATAVQDYEPTGLDEPGILGSIEMFISSVLNSTAFLPVYLDSLGLPASLVALITGPVWFMYGAFLFQVITGRPLLSYL